MELGFDRGHPFGPTIVDLWFPHLVGKVGPGEGRKLSFKQQFSTCGSWSPWGSCIRLQFKTVSKLRLGSSSKSNFMVGGHHIWGTVLRDHSTGKIEDHYSGVYGRPGLRSIDLRTPSRKDAKMNMNSMGVEVCVHLFCCPVRELTLTFSIVFLSEPP